MWKYLIIIGLFLIIICILITLWIYKISINKILFKILALDCSSKDNQYRFLISSQCNNYQDWQTSALYWSIKEIWPKVAVTRLLACEKTDSYKYLEIMPTTVTKEYQDIDGESYLPFNKPGSITEYFETNDPKEEYMILVDPDMVLLRDFKEFKPTENSAYGQKYDHMLYGQEAGAENVGEGLLKIARILEPDLNPDLLQPIGVPIIIKTNNLRQIAPLWLEYTKRIRNNKECNKIAGWIAEMQAYAIASAVLGIRYETLENLCSRYPYKEESPYSYHYDLPHYDTNWNKRDYVKDMLISNELMPLGKMYDIINSGLKKTRDIIYR